MLRKVIVPHTKEDLLIQIPEKFINTKMEIHQKTLILKKLKVIPTVTYHNFQMNLSVIFGKLLRMTTGMNF
jgi:hypothetical protein